MSELERQFLDAYEAHADAIFRHCYFRVHDREEAQDLMQETFTRTWDYLAEGKTVDNIRAFLYRIATNLIIDRSRKKSSHSLDELTEGGLQIADPQAHHQVATTVDVHQALKILDQLPDEQRILVTMRYVEDMRPKDIARILGLSENVVSVRLHRALKTLQQLYHYE